VSFGQVMKAVSVRACWPCFFLRSVAIPHAAAFASSYAAIRPGGGLI
jgi:hypothetical protein